MSIIEINKAMKRCFITTIISSLLYCNISTNSFGKEDRYQVFTGNFLNIDDSFQDTNTDFKLFGKSRFNLLNVSRIRNENYSNVSNIDLENHSVTVEYLNDRVDNIGGNRAVLESDILKYIKANTEYTFIYEYELISNPYNEPCQLGIAIDGWTGYLASSDLVEEEGSKGIVINSYASGDDVSKYSSTLNFYNRRGKNSKWKISNVMVYEGNFNSESVTFHKGMKSAGELNDSNSITIFSQNKNLVNELEYGSIDFSTGNNHEIDTCYRSADFIRVKPNSRLIYSSDGKSRNLNVFFYNKNKEFLYKREGVDYIVDVPHNCHYIKFYHYTNNSNNAQLEYGDTITSYEAPIIHSKTIPLTEPLYSLPNGTKDLIFKKNNKWVIERNVKKVILGKDVKVHGLISNNFQNDSTIGLNIALSDRKPSSTKYKDNALLIDGLPVVNYSDIVYATSTLEGFFADTTYKSIYCRLKRSKLSGFDLNSINQYFEKNPITILYELETPIYEELNIDLLLPTYNDTTIIFNDSIIEPDMQITIDRIANIAIEYLDKAVEDSTQASISLARMWINQMPESLLKDELQIKLNNISNFSDLQLDKKLISSNLDIYIKLENMLSLSLNTNCVEFENFSGIEDLKINNAANVSVNSSLPYDLNAYLETDIQNKDKSKKLNVDILNIKEGSETNYKTFNNIKEKLILKSDNEAGNNIIHNIDLMLKTDSAHDADIYKTTIKLEIEQK